MPKLEDLTGKRFGRLVVTCQEKDQIAKDGKKRTMWHCVCDCGNALTVRASHLKDGLTTSCGCYGLEKRTESITVHGHYYSRLYGVWRNMKNRCYNPKVKCYFRYGGRGIKVCDEWLHDFEAFYRWAMETGYDEKSEYMKCTLDRIDLDGDYEPSNCRWATAKEQAQNRRHGNQYKRNYSAPAEDNTRLGVLT